MNGHSHDSYGSTLFHFQAGAYGSVYVTVFADQDRDRGGGGQREGRHSEPSAAESWVRSGRG